MQDLASLQRALEQIELRLATEPLADLAPFERDGRAVHVWLTSRFVRRVRRARVWKSAAMLTALKNAGYGFDPARARSVGGRDGVFLLDRAYDNAMTRKVFDQFLDREGDPDLAAVTATLGADVSALQGVRVVSHHLRLLGVMHRTASEDRFALVDFERHTAD